MLVSFWTVALPGAAFIRLHLILVIWPFYVAAIHALLMSLCVGYVTVLLPFHALLTCVLMDSFVTCFRIQPQNHTASAIQVYDDLLMRWHTFRSLEECTT